MANLDIQTITLANGLTVVTEERHTAPVVSFWTGYRVGSRDERPGITGAAHWIEHMLFKPTEAFPHTERDRLISREGGRANAFTWFDGTAYYATLPSTAADVIYRIEADRMANSVFDVEVTETERTVILAERNQSENLPDWRLSEQVIATLFPSHPYGHDTIGHRRDLETMTRADLYSFYRTFYTPNNAVAVAVGSFDTAEVQDRIARLFGDIPRGPEPPRLSITESPQTSERRVPMEGPGETAYVEVAYRGIDYADPDFIPAALLVTILGGPISLALGSDGTSRSSRLYRELVEGELAVDVSCAMEATIEPFVIDIAAMVWQDRTHAEVESAIDRVIDGVASHPVSEDELARAKKQLVATLVYDNERISGRAMMLTLAHLVFGTELLDTYTDRIAAVTVTDIQRVAARLLRRTNRVVGYYIPTDTD